MPDLIEPQAATLDGRNRGAPWCGPTCPTYPTIKEGGNTSPLGAHRAPARPRPPPSPRFLQIGWTGWAGWTTPGVSMGYRAQPGWLSAAGWPGGRTATALTNRNMSLQAADLMRTGMQAT